MARNSSNFILIEGARQNNLKGINLKLPLNELIVVTGVSGSGKSSLAFDTIYAEGQRRYVETFSPYARQFLDRMDKPKADRIDGIPPSIAIDQTNPVKTSRSTVGTMTELNDHLKLLFARAAQLFCRGCGKPVRRDTAQSIFDRLESEIRSRVSETCEANPKSEIAITFPVIVPKNFSEEEVRDLLAKQGYHKLEKRGDAIEVVQDNVVFAEKNRSRIVESLEAALKVGQGRVNIFIPHPSSSSFVFRATSTAPIATFTTAIPCRTCSRSTRPSARAKFAADSVAPSALTTASSFRTTPRRSPGARSGRGRRRVTANVRTT